MDYRMAWVVMVVTALGCGPSAGDDDTTSASTGAEDSTGSSGASATETSAGEDSTGAGLACEAYADEVASRPATIEIRNVAATPLLFNDPCSTREYVNLTTPSELAWPQGFCTLTCDDAFLQGCVDCGACADAAYTVVPPGGSLTLEWDGRLFEGVSPPTECYEGFQCSPSCPRARADYDEMVTVTVEAITQADCTAVEEDPSACTCEPGPDGSCETFGSALIDPTVQAVVEVAPGTASILVEIGA